MSLVSHPLTGFRREAGAFMYYKNIIARLKCARRVRAALARPRDARVAAAERGASALARLRRRPPLPRRRAWAPCSASSTKKPLRGCGGAVCGLDW